MDTDLLGYADEILSMDLDESMTRGQVESYLFGTYGISDEDAAAVLAILRGEGYFD